MGFDYLSSNGELEGKAGNQNMCGSDSVVVDVERFSNLIHKKDINSNLTINRNISRKGCPKPATVNQSNDNMLPATLGEKPSCPKLHHQIVVKNGAPASEKKQFGAPRSIDPRRILIFFATLSSLGTILLIYFTLSIAHLNNDLSS